MSVRSSHLAVILSVAAVVVAGCGSSSKSKSAPAPAASTPATPSTSTTSTAASPTLGTPKISASDPVGSAAFKTAYIQYLVSRGIPSSQATTIVTCLIPKLEAQGYKVAGDIKGQKAQVTSLAVPCVKQAGFK